MGAESGSTAPATMTPSLVGGREGEGPFGRRRQNKQK